MAQSSPPTNGTAALQARLNDPDTADKLNQLLDRLDTIERAVEVLEQLNEQVPAALNIATDTIDEELTRAADRGVVLDERAREALKLAEKLTDPHTVEVLTQLMERIDQLEQLAALADQLPAALATTADIADETLTRAAERGVVLDERAGEALKLAEKLTEPETARALHALMDQADQLEQLAMLGEQAPGFIAMIVDIVDAEYARAAEHGYDPEQTLRQAFNAMGRLGELFRSDEFQALLDSGVLDPKALRAVGSLGGALVQSQEEANRGTTPQLGFFGLLGALRDPDVQHALGFIMRFAKHFGRNLRR